MEAGRKALQKTFSLPEDSNEFLLTQLESTSTWFTYFIDYINQNIPLMVLVWMLGILFMGLRMIGEITYVYHLKNYQKGGG